MQQHRSRHHDHETTTTTTSISQQERVSITKSITHLMQVPSNRSCADCRCALVDSLQIRASFRPRFSILNDFFKRHYEFAPPGFTPSVPPNQQHINRHDRKVAANTVNANHSNNANNAATTRGLVREDWLEGHGVFLCGQCGNAHKLLGPSIACVRPVMDASNWTVEEAAVMERAGGNSHCNAVYEAFVPYWWDRQRPTVSSSLVDRLTFCRAKYEALAFITPLPGPLSDRALGNIVSSSPSKNDNNNNITTTTSIIQGSGGQLEVETNINSYRDTYSVVMARVNNYNHHSINGRSHNNGQNGAVMHSSGATDNHTELPDRLMDYFCVIGSSGFLSNTELDQREDLISQTTGPQNLLLEPKVLDCFPKQDHYDDTEFPVHLPFFVFPEGCRVSSTSASPSFFTIALTCADGSRLYGGVLHLCDELMDDETFSELFAKSGYDQEDLPSWASGNTASASLSEDQDENNNNNSNHKDHDKNRASGSSSSTLGVAFAPKCLVILSHYPFYDLWQKMLLQLYRITLVEAPLPIERYIANIVAEIPLPPPGKIEVRFGFTTQDVWPISRPPENELPLVNFSYKPLFATLSVVNVIVVVGCLMQEARVALFSRHYAVLTPVAEAFMSLLFPLQWQGMYIPVLPYSMLDVLDAPVPFIVGVHSRYLAEKKWTERPHGVVYVDLDNDVVHLGFDDFAKPQPMPSLPDRMLAKLKAKLDEFGESVYLVPQTKRKGTVTSGSDLVVPNTERHPCMGMVDVEGATDWETRKRHGILNMTDKAYQQMDQNRLPIDFGSEHGQLSKKKKEEDNHSPKNSPRKKKKFVMKKEGEPRLSQGSETSVSSSGRNRLFAVRRNLIAGGGSNNNHSHKGKFDGFAINLLDMSEPEEFSSEEIRNAFLRFFVTLFKNYARFLSTEGFRSTEFLADLNLSGDNHKFVEQVLKTQMFDFFVKQREDQPQDPLFRFFDESILAKQNRSKYKRSKEATPFLDDKSEMITDTFIPPAPSNWGLPSDGRTYQYGSFPPLDPGLFGKTRAPMSWPTKKTINRRASISMRRNKTPRTSLWHKEIVFRAVDNPITLINKSKSVNNLKSAMRIFKNFKSSGEIDKNIKDQLHTSFRYIDLDDYKTMNDELHKSFRNIGLVAPTNNTITPKNSEEQIIIEARQIRGILLGILVNLQAAWRAYKVRMRYRHFRRALQVLQRKFRGTTHYDNPAVRTAEAVMFNAVRKGTIRLQQVVRIRQLRRELKRKLCSVAVMQRWYRAERVRRVYHAMRRIATKLQALKRGYQIRLGYVSLKDLVSKTQARARGNLARKRASTLLSGRLSKCREQIFVLWKRAHTPLSYRTIFWPLITLPPEQCGYVRLHIAESELSRLWIQLELDTIVIPRVYNDDELFRLGELLGVNNYAYRQLLKVEEELQASGGQQQQQHAVATPVQTTKTKRRQTLTFKKRPSNASLLGDSSRGITYHDDVHHGYDEVAADRVRAERIQIYERLSSTEKDWFFVPFFRDFGITPSLGYRKARLATLVWESAKTAHLSVSIMMELFPELEESTNIAFTPPSKKGIKRFKKSSNLKTLNPMPKPLDKSMWVHLLLKDVVSRAVFEVAENCLRLAPTTKHTKSTSSPRAVMIDSSSSSGVVDPEFRRVTISKLLHGK